VKVSFVVVWFVALVTVAQRSVTDRQKRFVELNSGIWGIE
jgi:hypothetical protein